MAITTTTTHSLDMPGATIQYDVRRAVDRTPLMLIGSPMDARGFGTLSTFLPDRTLVTYDPRGVHRSIKAHAVMESTPDEHASDLLGIIDTLGVESVDLFASSGGAVNALALVAQSPERVRRLIAHEPPAMAVLPDHEPAASGPRWRNSSPSRCTRARSADRCPRSIPHDSAFPPTTTGRAMIR